MPRYELEIGETVRINTVDPILIDAETYDDAVQEGKATVWPALLAGMIAGPKLDIFFGLDHGTDVEAREVEAIGPDDSADFNAAVRADLKAVQLMAGPAEEAPKTPRSQVFDNLVSALRDIQEVLLQYDGWISAPQNQQGWTEPDAYAAYMRAEVALKAIGSQPPAPPFLPLKARSVTT